MSISSVSLVYIGVLVANFKQGAGLEPNIEPRPVVKAIRLAPPAIWPVADTGSKPGVSIKTKPLVVTGSAYLYTSIKGPVPPFIDEPSDFSKILASPPI